VTEEDYIRLTERVEISGATDELGKLRYAEAELAEERYLDEAK
jgi:hypothetical protein